MHDAHQTARGVGRDVKGVIKEVIEKVKVRFSFRLMY